MVLFAQLNLDEAFENYEIEMKNYYLKEDIRK